jgi:hypothetical protein
MIHQEHSVFFAWILHQTGNHQMRQEHTAQMIFEELSTDTQIIAVFQEQRPSDLHPVGLQIPRTAAAS